MKLSKKKTLTERESKKILTLIAIPRSFYENSKNINERKEKRNLPKWAPTSILFFSTFITFLASDFLFLIFFIFSGYFFIFFLLFGNYKIKIKDIRINIHRINSKLAKLKKNLISPATAPKIDAFAMVVV